MGMDLNMKFEERKLAKLLDELLALKPRLSVVQTQMKAAGLVPGPDLVACMEKTLKALEQSKMVRDGDSEVDNEV